MQKTRQKRHCRRELGKLGLDESTRPVAAAIVILLLTYILFSLLLAPVCKILLDVVRYIGISKYRDDLQSKLHNVIESIDQATQVIVVAHSLGSVIAVDSLLADSAWVGREDVVLITVGSPLRRLIGLFFPDVFFPNPLSECGKAIAKRMKRFNWFNCYRFWDPIGGALHLRFDGATHDLLVPALHKVLTAHVNYWSDRRVIETVANAVEGGTRVTSDARSPAWSRPMLELGVRSTREVVRKWLDMSWIIGSLVFGVCLSIGLGGTHDPSPIVPHASILDEIAAYSATFIMGCLIVGVPAACFMRWVYPPPAEIDFDPGTTGAYPARREQSR